MKIGFTCGTFDLCHAGHMLMFKECKEYCDFLIVGLEIDPSKDRSDKNKPIQTLEERLIQLESIKYIDKVIVYDGEEELYNILSKNEFGISVRIIGADWENKLYTGHDLPIEVIFSKRSHNYSSFTLRKRVAVAENYNK